MANTMALEFKLQEMAERIKELREIFGYTKEEMAGKTDVTIAEYAMYDTFLPNSTHRSAEQPEKAPPWTRTRLSGSFTLLSLLQLGSCLETNSGHFFF